MKLRIFLVNEDVSIRKTIKEHLENLGHQVITTSEPLLCDIYNGCDCSKPHPCADALFIDQNIHGISGLEFIRRMQERGCKSDPSGKFIILGDAHSIDMDEVERIGCKVLEKPATRDVIGEIINSIKEKTKTDRKLNSFNGLFDKTLP